MQTDDTTLTADEQLLAHIRERFDYLTAEWKDIREASRNDRVNVADGPWTDKEVKARIAEDRGPLLVLDELSQYTNQAVNDVRQNKRAIKVVPKGNGATDKSAEAKAGMIRG